jgi:PleD family two-component response regulator
MKLATYDPIERILSQFETTATSQSEESASKTDITQNSNTAIKTNTNSSLLTTTQTSEGQSAQDESMRKEIKTKEKEGGSSCTKDTKLLKVLLVEDNQVNQLVIRRLLEKLSCQVVIANNGKEALDFLDNPRNASYDLILMDLQMPVLGTFSILKFVILQCYFVLL